LDGVVVVEESGASDVAGDVESDITTVIQHAAPRAVPSMWKVYVL
jgi:hypothetical protein